MQKNGYRMVLEKKKAKTWDIAALISSKEWV